MGREELNKRLNFILEWNSYTYMGCEYNFDYLADLVIGENRGHRRDVNLEAIKDITKLMNDEQLESVLDKMDAQKNLTLHNREEF